MISKAHIRGTHRARKPEDTLESIRPHLRNLGVTRCADVTRLDCLEIPTYCAIRPEGSTLQVSNGKGLSAVDAKVSALMEAIELFHAEHPPTAFHRSSERQMENERRIIAHASSLHEFDPASGHTDERIIDWVPGRDLLAASEVWIPAAAVYCLMHLTLFDWSTNGLASGNHRVEAALHAVLELIERHALSGLCVGDDVVFDSCHGVALRTITDEMVTTLVDQIARAGLVLVLLRVPTPAPVYTFMATLLDPNPFGPASHLSFGYGAHLSPAIAATRAITEAAQTRLTYIHGARNDLKISLYVHSTRRGRIEEFFKSFPCDTDWTMFSDYASADLETDLRNVVEGLRAAGHRYVYEVELTLPRLPIAVVRVFVEGMQRTFPM